MSFKLIGQQESVKENQTYIIRVYFDSDTNTQRNEFILEDEILYHMEFEQHEIQEENDVSLNSVVSGFDDWYEQFGPDWRPHPF